MNNCRTLKDQYIAYIESGAMVSFSDWLTEMDRDRRVGRDLIAQHKGVMEAHRKLSGKKEGPCES